jgi:hypothetical protein
MSIIEFTSPMLNAAVEDLHRVGYVLKNEQEGYDQQGNRVVVKVLYCERNQLQVVIQTTKIPTNVEHEADNGDGTPCSGSQEDVFTVDITVEDATDKPTNTPDEGTVDE